MNTAKARKLQSLLITELLDKGSVELILPDGITLEIGILQEDECGDLRKTRDYCYVVATRDGKSTILDSYNVGVQFEGDEDTLIYEDEVLANGGRLVKTLDVI